MKLIKKAGYFYKKNFNKWEKYFGMLHGSYLYIFNDIKDEIPASYLYMRRINITEIEL